MARPIGATTKMKTIYLGDSIFDVGTNQLLSNSISRCDFVPYGMSKFQTPSGRCSDGYLILDLVNKAFQIPLPQRYLGLKKGDKPPSSINFAFDGSGLLDNTHSFNKQVQQLGELSKNLKDASEYVVVISSGGNDIAANLQGSIDFQKMLENLKDGIKKIHGIGFRKIVYSSIGPLGCAPVVIGSIKSGGGCISQVNELAESFNNRVKQVLLDEEEELTGLKTSFFDGYNFMMTYIENPSKYGFKSTGGCCPNCLSRQNTEEGLCKNPSDYVFWDGIHPTEHMYKLLTNELVKQLIKNPI